MYNFFPCRDFFAFETAAVLFVNLTLQELQHQTKVIVLASSPLMASEDALASPFASCSRVTSRDSPNG